MRTPDRPQLSKSELSRIRQALVQEHLGDARREPAARSLVALFIGISAALWHGAGVRSLSLAPTSAVQSMRFVSPQAGTARTEQNGMQRLTIVGALAAASAALGQNGGFARFSATTDTIRIQGNTVFGLSDYTYEARIRVLPGSALGQVVSEQRNALEDKSIGLAASGSYGISACSPDSTGAFRGTIAGFPAGEWIHLAYVHRGPNVYIYVDGTLSETHVPIACYGDHADSWMSIGMFRSGAPSSPQPAIPSFLGDLDWIRISSTARYAKDFTPPYECEIVPDAQTQLVLKVNEPAGTPTLVDESPSRFLCELGVPVSPGVTATAPSLGNASGGFPACTPLCDSDVDANDVTDGIDLAIVLARWGTNPTDYPRADTNLDGIVDGTDLALVLNGWGGCR